MDTDTGSNSNAYHNPRIIACLNSFGGRSPSERNVEEMIQMHLSTVLTDSLGKLNPRLSVKTRFHILAN